MKSFFFLNGHMVLHLFWEYASRGTAKVVMVAKARFVLSKFQHSRFLDRPAGWGKGYPMNYGFGPWDGGKGMMMGAYGGMMMPPMPLAFIT